MIGATGVRHSRVGGNPASFRESFMEKQFFVYLLGSHRNGTLYIGVTSNLPARIYQHKSHVTAGFTRRYKVNNLLWFEAHDSAESAIVREKQMKKWRRAWKIALIEENNPYWRDLYDELFR